MLALCCSCFTLAQLMILKHCAATPSRRRWCRFQVFLPLLFSVERCRYGIYQQLGDESLNLVSFLVFSCTGLAATAMPVLARVLAEARLLGTTVGSMALHAAAVDDAVVIAIICLEAAVVQSDNGLTAVWTLLSLLALIAFMAFFVRPMAARAADVWLRSA